jgi:predicted peptidase
MTFEALKFEKMDYMVRYPNGYRAGERYPVILNLHGAGTRGQTVDQLTEQCCYRVTAEMEDYPFVTVAPLCYENTWFDMYEVLRRFVMFLAREPFCDPDRLYLMGGSMGGYTAWQLGMSLPEYFAAMVPICGGGMYWNAARLKDVPVWAFHGAKDPTVLCRESEIMVEKVNLRGGNARLTVYPENKHDAWTDTYSNPEVYAWLLSHRRAGSEPSQDSYSKNPGAFG